MNLLYRIVMSLGLVAAPLSAQETRVAEEGFESPPASIYEMQWLEGQWQGEGIEGAPAMESWLPPTGTTMVGSFVQQTADGGIMFTEHMYLMEQDGSLVVKLKHFNADLTGWEDKEGMVTFRLLELEPCAAYFNALTYRCGDDGSLIVAVRMKSDKPEPQELVFRFTRAPRASVTYDCDGSTVEMNNCMAEILGRAEATKDTYLAAARTRFADDDVILTAIERSEESFAAYRKNECNAVYDQWREGTIRTMMSLTCSIGLTDARTRTIWENWLGYGDRTPADLPEPQPTQ